MSQYDERDPAHPADPDGSTGSEPVASSDPAPTSWDDTQPIGATPDPRAPEHDAGPPAPADGQHDEAVTPVPDGDSQDPPGRQQPAPQEWPAPTDTQTWPTAAYGAGYQPGYGHEDHYGQPGPGYPPAAQKSGGQAGWFWPVVAATALVVGLLGGTLAAVAVNSTMDDGTISIPAIETDGGTAPLEADNGSISAVAEQLLPSTVQIMAGGGGGTQGAGATGSGFVLDRKGHVITNNHVVADATGTGEIEVVDHQGQVHPVKIVGRSPVYDIAVLLVEDPGNLRPAALGSSQAMRIGESVVAIGSPLGLSSTVTSGIVSALDRPVTTGTQDDSSYINAVQTDAAINPGNSGGPLVNLRGQVVGVNSAIATMGGSFGGEAGNIGVGFAIPMEQVRVTAAQILATGEAKYPVIGANVNTGDQRGGAEVVDVPSGTPAAAAGLREGDVVVGVDDKVITDGIGLIVAIRSHQPGETISLTVQRDGDEIEVDVTLDAKVG